MLNTFFAWLRRRAAESVLAGVNDAAKQLESDAERPGPPPLLVWHGGAIEDDEEAKPTRRTKATA